MAAAMKEIARKLGVLLHSEGLADGAGEVIEAGDFRIDLGNRKVAVRGQEVDLTTAEFDLLLFLVRHPKRAITSHTLLSTRCGDDSLRQTEFLPVLMGLRKKIEANSASPHYIRTEPWIFYRFDPS